VSTNVWDTASLQQIDPRTLLLDSNSRTIIDLETEDPDLVASVRQHGVKLPVIASRVDDNRLRVLDGHSRTIAAVLAVAEHPTIPVLVTDASDGQEWELLRDQWIANEVRRGYSTADKARIMEELTLFGLSAQDIAGQLSTTVETVEAGLAVRRSAKVTDAMGDYPQLDVLQLAALAEFEDDADAYADLENTLAEAPEQFDHTVSQLRHRRIGHAIRDAKMTELREAGVTVLDQKDTATTLQLTRLRRSRRDDTNLGDEPDSHRDCPGHAAIVSVSCGEPKVTYVCQDWKTHRHVDAWTTSRSAGHLGHAEQSESEKAERRRVRVNNEAWRAAQDVRRHWLRTVLFAGTKPPKRAHQHILLAMAEGGSHLTQAMTRGNRYACQLLGAKEPEWNQPSPIAGRAKRASADQALMMSLAVVMGAFEEAFDSKHTVNTWRQPYPEDRLYLAALQDWGYTLSKVEQLVLDPSADTADWPHLMHGDSVDGPTSDSGTTESDPQAQEAA
jgi:ParB family transcriptional regulator, chromosome partitioning protein